MANHDWTFIAVASLPLCIACGGSPDYQEDRGETEIGAVSERLMTNECVFQTSNGRFVTAVGGGGRTTDVIHTDATRAGAWETFTKIYPNANLQTTFGLRRSGGLHYLTAVGGGGRTTDVIRSDATAIGAYQLFTFTKVGRGFPYLLYPSYAIVTYNGNVLTAVDGGGRTTDAIHSDATSIDPWETFTLTCG